MVECGQLNYIFKASHLHPNVVNSQGEEYQLFWPEESEFVRMAARFGAKIVPFGAVGEDDITEVSPIPSLSTHFGQSKFHEKARSKKNQWFQPCSFYITINFIASFSTVTFWTSRDALPSTLFSLFSWLWIMMTS